MTSSSFAAARGADLLKYEFPLQRGLWLRRSGLCHRQVSEVTRVRILCPVGEIIKKQII